LYSAQAERKFDRFQNEFWPASFRTSEKVMNIKRFRTSEKVMNIKQLQPQGDHDSDGPSVNTACSWCGTTIRTQVSLRGEQICLICHARFLNDYLHRIREREANRTSGEVAQ